MSFLPVLEYISGFFVFGFVYLIFDDIINGIRTVSATGDVYNVGLWIWIGIIIIYIIGGMIWLWDTYSSPQYKQNNGGFM